MHTIIGVNHPPEWSAPLEDLEITVGETLIYSMPSYSDVDVLDIMIEELSVSGLDVLPAFMFFSSN